MALGQKCAQKQRAGPDQDSRNGLQSAPDPDLEQSQSAQNQALATGCPLAADAAEGQGTASVLTTQNWKGRFQSTLFST